MLINEFANENLREQCNDGVDGAGITLNFTEFQRCFLPCESPELRAELTQRECETKQAYLPL